MKILIFYAFIFICFAIFAIVRDRRLKLTLQDYEYEKFDKPSIKNTNTLTNPAFSDFPGNIFYD